MKVEHIAKLVLSLGLVVGMCGCGFLNTVKAKDNLNKAAAAYNDGNYDLAIALLEDAIKLDPSLPQLKPYYGASLYAKYNLGGDEEYVRKALDVYIEIYDEEMKKSSPDAQVVKNAVAYIAVIYGNLGEESKYRDWMEKRLDLPDMQPKDKAEIHYGLGTAYWKDSFEISQKYIVRQGIEPVYGIPEEEVPKIRQAATKGLEYIEQALAIDPEYGDALSYKNLLLRELAKIEKDPRVKQRLMNEANDIRDRALQLINRKQEEARKAAQQNP